MEIRWSVLAADDLERICAWIARDNPESAARIAKTVYEGCAQLKDFPHLGKASKRISGRRELAFPPLPYIAVYQVKGNAIEISRDFLARRTGRNSRDFGPVDAGFIYGKAVFVYWPMEKLGRLR